MFRFDISNNSGQILYFESKYPVNLLFFNCGKALFWDKLVDGKWIHPTIKPQLN